MKTRVTEKGNYENIKLNNNGNDYGNRTGRR